MNYKDRVYDVVSYNPEWPERFFAIAEDVKKAFGTDALDIQHIGSTSVPGMDGKPTIDVLVLVENIEVADRHISAMQALGYTYAGQVVRDNSRLFRVAEGNEILVNIHIFQKDHPHVHEMIELRDYFRVHPEGVAEYSHLKREIYAKYKTDYAQYRKCKDDYLNGVLKNRT